MSVRILLIGASGHIGAAVLEALISATLDAKIIAVVRSDDDFDHIVEKYNGSVETRLISLSDAALLTREASEAQIAINCAPDVGNSPGIAALLSSLASDDSQPNQKFYIHTSGAARTWGPPDPTIPGDKIWDDIADLGNLPTETTHAETDIQVQQANSETLHTAIVSPCFVIGKSPSRKHRVPITFPDWHHVTRSVGSAWTIGPGANLTTFVDTVHLAQLYLLLVKDALSVILSQHSVRNEVWGPEAYYFAEGIEISIREFTEREVVPALMRNEAAKGWIAKEGNKIKELELDWVVNSILTRLGGTEGADLWSRHIAEGFGTSMRIRGSRAREYLGWEAGEGVDLDEAVEAYVQSLGEGR
ncbi:hypothetical protein QBC44DRAFT_311671 [Cladorrhinum sp. PSN332]|nr:hypothetical protein QBC44DRAFT_311671 [Cladorrhinum sp. PSN332]